MISVLPCAWVGELYGFVYCILSEFAYLSQLCNSWRCLTYLYGEDWCGCERESSVEYSKVFAVLTFDLLHFSAIHSSIAFTVGIVLQSRGQAV